MATTTPSRLTLGSTAWVVIIAVLLVLMAGIVLFVG